MIGELAALEAGRADGEHRAQSLLSLRDRLAQLSEKATAAEESPEQSRARRVLRALSSGVSARISDREYLELIEKFGMRGR
jgi:hypothetical protein